MYELMKLAALASGYALNLSAYDQPRMWRDGDRKITHIITEKPKGKRARRRARGRSKGRK